MKKTATQKTTKKKVVKKRTIRDYQKQARFFMIENEKLTQEVSRQSNQIYDLKKINERLADDLGKTKRDNKDIESNLAFNSGMIEVYERYTGHKRPQPIQGIAGKLVDCTYGAVGAIPTY